MTLSDRSASSLDLSIIIVSWNVCALLRNCLHSIANGRGDLRLEVIVVDGASHDDTVEVIRSDFPWVQLIACTENVGFPRGNNMGMAQANGRCILLLNPDTVVVEDALTVLVAYLDAHEDVGVVGPQLRYPDGAIQSSRRRFPTLLTGLVESTWLQSLAPQKIMRDYYALDLVDEETAVVDWLMGACLLVPKTVVEQVGGMDEAYFMYSEELDWCRRIKEAGWGVVYLPTAKIIHHEGKSSEQAVTARHINFQRAKLRYFRKFHGRLSAALLRLVLLLNYTVQIMVEGVKALLGHKRPLRKQRIKAYLQVVRSGLKPAGY